MSREWKPGDVVAATVDGRENVRLVAGWSRYEPQLRWCEVSPRWGNGDDEECWFMPERVTDARPLVVIDPENEADVERLADEIFAAMSGVEPTFYATQAALRSLIEPPKPDGPTGLGAVVEDANGNRWVSVTNRGADDRWQPNNLRSDKARKGYADIAAVRVLSEGVDW